MEKNKRLYRSTKSKMIGGVAGGIAEYFDIDPVIIRLLFLIIALAGGGGAVVYIILWIALPVEPFTPFTMNQGFAGDTAQADSGTSQSTQTEPTDNNVTGTDIFKSDNKSGLIGGILLISVGLIFLANRFLPDIDFGDLWPLVLVVLGGVLIATSFAERKKPTDNQ